MFARLSSFVVVSLFAVTGLAGCSSSGDDESSLGVNQAKLSGAVGKLALTPQSAIARHTTTTVIDASGKSSTVKAFSVLISDKANDCSSLHAQGSTNLTFTIVAGNPGPNTSYPVVDAVTVSPKASEAEMDFNAVDGACKDTIAEPAKSGSIAITGSDVCVTGPCESHVSGTFDATFADGVVKGEFNAVICDGDAPASPSGAPICNP